MYIDSDNQPPRFINADLRKGRGVTELIGIAKGVLADGVFNSYELQAVLDWLQANQECWGEFPANIVTQRVNRYLEDRYIDDDETKDLTDLLYGLTGAGAGGLSGSTTLAYNDPPPSVEFEGREFVFTGKFVYGPRRVCEKAVTTLGGTCHNTVRRSTSFVVVGTFASRDWVATSYGTKIEDAAHCRDNKGYPLAIISEDHWAAALP